MIIQTITPDSNQFHHKFHTIKYQPKQIHYLGNLSLLDKPLIAIVGPRRPSSYAEQVLKNIFEVAQQYDVVTISGLAPGVDQLVHRYSLTSELPTIAVLGGGISHYQSRTDGKLLSRIVEEGGLIISEFDHNFIPQSYSFPQRNRIIAGLSDIIILPEAGKKSGSLITVDFATMMKKPVYATPQSIFFKHSEGILEYMEEGKIKPLVNIEKFFQKHFGWRKQFVQTKKSPSENHLSEAEHKVVICLQQNDGISLESIANQLQISPQVLLPQLTILELKNVAYQVSPGIYTTNLAGITS